ncbi:hemerythrin domain-containing protein [Microtetraspora fusca]|uniref:hemerythrin domain-containing protein n=1 Tax=Microtetraspora fusca TaxID=1997 RepID=UPI0008317B5A|nr:hemerythrin domain-containing protein [Microtetraspora fusca]
MPYGSARPGLSRKLSRHCLLFCDALHGHHTNEDGAFADFEKRFPYLAPALDRLRKEHRVVAQAVADLQALLANLTPEADELSTGTSVPEARDTATPGTRPAPTDTDDAAALLAELERLSSQLEEHFAYEEAHLIPALTGEPPRTN